jgi:hypothetical protein
LSRGDETVQDLLPHRTETCIYGSELKAAVKRIENYKGQTRTPIQVAKIEAWKILFMFAIQDKSSHIRGKHLGM